jgi:hypothetical protein
MAPRIEFAPPTATAGVMSVKCECGWEVVLIQPEENIFMLNLLFAHLLVAHHLNLPLITCFWH